VGAFRIEDSIFLGLSVVGLDDIRFVGIYDSTIDHSANIASGIGADSI
jgi:hypothetical protein